MTTKLAKLTTLLRGLFQLDQADLDFGIYRVMNQKRAEVEHFLDHDLLPQVKTAFEKYRPADTAAVQRELDKLVAAIESAGMNPDDSPKIQGLRAQLTARIDVAALEDEVFSALFTFFRRYYHGGDFHSQRRYKAGVYAIPYEGEEVKLHWANHDQYYIKSSEHLSHYGFTVGDRSVRFELAAAGTERDNNKTRSGQERRFILATEAPVSAHEGTLTVRFEYRLAPAKQKQPGLNAQAAAAILEAVSADWAAALGQPAPTKANPARTILHKHLHRYTARNTFDYFIHKDLGGFLRRELDFFIKNEILLLDDIDQVSDFSKVEETLSKIRVLRVIAHKIIAFLAQLEDFQKKLWLKKKFVVESQWCVTLDRIPAAFYPEIAASAPQRAEWVRLFAIDRIAGDQTTPGYSEPLTVAFLEANQSLSVDTCFLSPESRERLIEHLLASGGAVHGLLVHADNLQALRLLRERFRSQIDLVYMDPPYNTGGDGFVYKDNYRHASWMSFIQDRLAHIAPLLSDAATLFASIDDHEAWRLRSLLDDAFGTEAFEAQLVIQSNKRGQTYKSVAKTHEYLFAYGPSVDSKLRKLPRDNTGLDADEQGAYELWELRNRNPKFGRFNRPNLYFPFFVAPSTSSPADGLAEVSLQRSDTFCVEVTPLNSAGEASCWRWGTSKVREALSSGGKGILVGKQKRDGSWGIYQKARLDGTKAKTIWLDKAFINERGTVQANHMGLREFGFPKPLGLLSQVLTVGSGPEGWVMDPFAGSGTTGHAVVESTRQPGEERKFLLIESGTYFDRVTRPRVRKAAYAREWKDGLPQSRGSGSQCIQYIRLESYEDALDNLELQARSGPQQQLLAASRTAREDYTLSYMLDMETRGSASLLNLERFNDPFHYTLKVTQNNETCLKTVNLVETFNFLLGLRVERMQARVHLTAELKPDEHGRLQVYGDLKPCSSGEGWTFRVVQGHTADGRVLVVWRVLTDDPEKDNLMLDTFCLRTGLLGGSQAFDRIYVNGDHNLAGLRRTHDTWTAHLIEESFHQRMFDSADA